jgi:hypothetical protein
MIHAPGSTGRCILSFFSSIRFDHTGGATALFADAGCFFMYGRHQRVWIEPERNILETARY